MSFERRGGGTYYYRARKVGGRVVKHYVGSGALAYLIAEEDAAVRAEREANAKRWRKERARLRALDAPVDQLSKASDVLTAAALVLGGYHQHKRQWRKRRQHE